MGENKLVHYSIIFIALVLLVVVLKDLQSIFRPLALALMITLWLSPYIRKSKEKGIPFGVMLLGVTLCFIIVIGFGIYLLPDSLKITGSFSKTISEYQEKLA